MRYYQIIVLLVASIYLFGCASGAKVENMVYKGDQKNYSSVIKNNMKVEQVSGGQKTNPMLASQIDSNAFSNALKQSLDYQGLYSESGNYSLNAKILNVEQPIFGLDFKVTTRIQYVLKDINSGNIILDTSVDAPYVATVSDALVGIERLRIANEGSAQSSIEKLLNILSELRIKPMTITLEE